MGEIGNLKNRLKTWWNNKKRLKKLEEQELNDKKKKKKYNRFQVVTRTILGLFLGFLEVTIFSSKKKERKVRVKEMKMKLKQLQEETTMLVKKQEDIIKMIPKIKTKEELVKVEKENRTLKEMIPILKKKKEELVEEIKKESQRTTQKNTKKQSKKNNKMKKETLDVKTALIVQEDIIDEISKKQEVITNQIIEQKLKIEENLKQQEKVNDENIVVKEKNNIKFNKKSIDADYEELKNYIKESNSILKEIDRYMKKLSEPVKDNEIGMTLLALDNLYDKIFPLYLGEVSIRKRIRLSKYIDDVELKKIDKNHFLKSDGVYKNRLEQCSSIEMKLQARNKAGMVAKEKKKDKKIGEKKNKVDYLENEKKKLRQDVIKQRLMISSLENSLNGLSGQKKKRGILSRIGALIKNTLFTGFGISTMIKSKHSMVGVLAGALITNHGIRGMRNMKRSSEDKLNYFDVEKIVERIKSEKDALILSLDFCSDSLEQLQLFKLELQREYPYTNDAEVLGLKEQVLEIEDQLLEQQQNLLSHQQQMDVIYEQGVQKVKRLEEKK